MSLLRLLRLFGSDIMCMHVVGMTSDTMFKTSFLFSSKVFCNRGTLISEAIPLRSEQGHHVPG